MRNSKLPFYLKNHKSRFSFGTFDLILAAEKKIVKGLQNAQNLKAECLNFKVHSSSLCLMEWPNKMLHTSHQKMKTHVVIVFHFHYMLLYLSHNELGEYIRDNCVVLCITNTWKIFEAFHLAISTCINFKFPKSDVSKVQDHLPLNCTNMYHIGTWNLAIKVSI